MVGARGWLAAAAIAAAACATGGGAEVGGPSTDGPFAYVANQESATVSVIDVDWRAAVATVDLRELGFSASAKPHDVAVEPDGSHWYLSLIGENRVLKFDRENRLVGRAEIEVPGLLALSPDGSTLWAGRSLSAVTPPSSVARIDTRTMEVEEEIEVLFDRPHALAVSPDGARVYSASLAENRLAVIHAGSGEVELVDVPGESVHTLVEFAVSPDGEWLVAGGEKTGTFLAWSLARPAAPELVASVELGGAPWHPVFAEDGSAVYVPLNRGDAVAVVDPATWREVDRIEHPALARPHGSAVTETGMVLVTSRNTEGTWTAAGEDPRAGAVVALDPRTGGVVDVMVVERHAAGIGVAGR